MNDIILPEDFTVFTQAPDAEWKSLERQGAAARARSVDLIGKLWIEEEGKGKAGWRARVQTRLGLDTPEGEDSKAHNTIGDYARVFKVFRLGGDTGLGWRIDELEQHSIRRLKVFASHGDWTRRNPDRVRDMLVGGATDTQLRAAVKEAVAAEAQGRGEEAVVAKSPAFTNFVLRVTPEDAELLRSILDGVLSRSEELGEEVGDNSATMYGNAAMQLAGHWFNGQSIMTRDGRQVYVENAEFVARAANEKMPNLSTEVQTEDAVSEEGYGDEAIF